MIAPERISHFIIWFAAALIITACLMRYSQSPSFWLDEAFVATSLRSPSMQTTFARLENKQFFPRIYLSAIALLRETFGYRIWNLRLLPFLCFLIGSLFWARLLIERANRFLLPGFVGAALLLGTFFWMEESSQLKQYTFEVLLALIPFLLSDDFYKRRLVDGRHKWSLLVLAIPCALSYCYPIALLARTLGWVLHHLHHQHRGKHEGWRLHKHAVSIFVAAIIFGLVSIYLTDHQFNLQDQPAYLAYWQHCIVRARLQEGVFGSGRLLADFFWGWHQGRLMLLVVAAIAPLQVLGAYHVIRRWRRGVIEAENPAWGSRSLGSLLLLAGAILASLVVQYPICAGRLTLFAQVHLQILTLEGALFILSLSAKSRIAPLLLSACLCIIAVYSTHRYISFVRDEPPENLRPMVGLINPAISETLWVHPCSVLQVQTWPTPLPVQNVVSGNRKELPEPGQRIWVMWTHLGEEHCRESLEKLRSQALSWQIINEGRGRGLALAEF